MRKIPLVIMTSDDTHLRTQQLVENNAFFGMDTSQITLLKQVQFGDWAAGVGLAASPVS